VYEARFLAEGMAITYLRFVLPDVPFKPLVKKTEAQ
jgi:hypothetical protein